MDQLGGAERIGARPSRQIIAMPHTPPIAGQEVRTVLIAATQQLVLQRGLHGLSLRAVAAAVGRSTTSVFQHFGSREALLQAALEDAVAGSAAWHNRYGAQLAGMPQDAASIAGMMAHYIVQSSASRPIRFCQQVLFTPGHLPDAPPLLAQWDGAQRAFWHGLLAGTPFVRLSPVIATYAVVETAYATALADQAGYALLLRETCAALLQGVVGTHDPHARSGTVAEWLLARTVTPPALEPPAAGAMQRLLDHAVSRILREGLAGLNLRSIARDAEVSPSLVNYHWGDFASFTRDAIWRALLHGLPRMLTQAGDRSLSGDEWQVQLQAAIRPGGGFYVNYARILGQLGMEAARDPQFAPLLAWLRAIEGSGIHSASHSAWPGHLQLGRPVATGFAIWIKGRAILNEASGSGQTHPQDQPGSVAALLSGH